MPQQRADKLGSTTQGTAPVLPEIYAIAPNLPGIPTASDEQRGPLGVGGDTALRATPVALMPLDLHCATPGEEPRTASISAVFNRVVIPAPRAASPIPG